jgi:hypothetical protein
MSAGLAILLVGISGCDDGQVAGAGNRSTKPEASASVTVPESGALFIWSDPDTPPGDQQADLEDCRRQAQQLGLDIGAQKQGFTFFWNLDCMAQKGWVLPYVYHQLTQ